MIRSINKECLENIWVIDEDTHVTLSELMVDYLAHLNLHLEQIKNCLGRTQP